MDEHRASTPGAGPDAGGSGAAARFPDLTIRLLLFALFVFAVFYTLYFAADLFRPIAAAVLLNILLSPLVRSLGRYRVPSGISAAVIVIVLLATASSAVVALSTPAGRWLDQAPAISHDIKSKLRDVLRPVENVKRATKEVDKLADPARDSAEQEVVVKKPSILERLFDSLQNIGIELTIAVVLLFFLLASGDMFKERLVAISPRLTDRKRALTVINTIERDAFIYLATVTAINFVLGIIISIGLFAVGMPNPILWGVAAAILNFVPYLGALIGISLVFVVGLIALPTLEQAFVAPAFYLLVTIFEGQFITPAILGRRLTMNPVIVFLSVVFWGWLWGVPGALMAVPFLVTVRALAANVEPLAPLAAFLRGRDKAVVVKASKPTP